MTATSQPTDLAQHVAWLESVLPAGHSLVHTRHRWYLRKWDSWVDRLDRGPRMSWREVDSDPRLERLLQRMERS